MHAQQEFQKIKLSKNVEQSTEAPLKITLSNQFYEDLRQLFRLKPFIKVLPFSPKCK
jgi:hypothetical protein